MLRLFLSPVVVRMVHGGTLAESLNVQAIRLGIPQLSMLSVIAHANMRFGGTLSEILTHVVASLNNRLQVQHEFDAMTAEMRASAKVLAALPVVVIALVFVLNPGYLVFFADDPLGQALIGAAFAFAVLGGFILRALTRIED
jgi:tight adherence protein B